MNSVPSDPSPQNEAAALARRLIEHGGSEVVALDIGAQSSFAEAFVIATAASTGQLRGLQRRVFEYLDEVGRMPRQSHKRTEESGWILIDCDDFIVHLMRAEQRSFYELERLWYDAKVLVDGRGGSGPDVARQPDASEGG